MSCGVAAVTAVSQVSVAPAAASGAVAGTSMTAAGSAVMSAATAAATVVAAGAAAIIVARLSVKAAEAGAEALIRLDEAMGRQAEEYVRAETLARDWQHAAIAVSGRNASLRACAGAARRLGVDVPLPPPYDLAGRNLCQVTAWCHEVDRHLADARAALAGRTAATVARKMAARVPDLPLPEAEAFLADYAPVLVTPAPQAVRSAVVAGPRASAEPAAGGSPTGGRTMAPSPSPSPSSSSSSSSASSPSSAPVSAASASAASASSSASAARSAAVAGQLAAVLRDVSPEVDPDQYVKIMTLAAQISRTGSVVRARGLLQQLREDVRRANAAAREATAAAQQRQADQQFASERLDLFWSAAVEPELGPGGRQTVRRLEEVAAGAAELTEPLRRETERLAARAGEIARRAYLREQTAEILRGLGYDVRADPGAASGGLESLRVTHDKLGAAEAAVVVGTDSVRHQMLRTRPAHDDGAVAREWAACEELNADMELVRDGLRLAGAVLGPARASGPESIQNAATVRGSDDEIFHEDNAPMSKSRSRGDGRGELR